MKLLLILLLLLNIHVLYAESNPQTLQAVINPSNNSVESNTWIGGDVASSIELSSNKYLWIFGDTLYGSVLQQSRHLNVMRHNSVAIMTCNPHRKECQMTKYGHRDIFTLKKKTIIFGQPLAAY